MPQTSLSSLVLARKTASLSPPLSFPEEKDLPLLPDELTLPRRGSLPFSFFSSEDLLFSPFSSDREIGNLADTPLEAFPPAAAEAPFFFSLNGVELFGITHS